MFVNNVPCFADTLTFTMFIRHFFFQCLDKSKGFFLFKKENVKQKGRKRKKMKIKQKHGCMTFG